MRRAQRSLQSKGRLRAIRRIPEGADPSSYKGSPESDSGEALVVRVILERRLGDDGLSSDQVCQFDFVDGRARGRCSLDGKLGGRVTENGGQRGKSVTERGRVADSVAAVDISARSEVVPPVILSKT